MSEPLIHARGLTKTYGDFVAVDGIDFDVAKGESFGFLGPNGAGKSTTMRIIGATSVRTSGTLTILGKDPEVNGPQIRAHLGVVPQQDNLDVELTVSENIFIYGRYFGLSSSFINKKIPELLEFAQLEEKKDTKVQALSGGMKRRLTIARSLVSEPDILMLDEPTTGLDPQARHILWDRLFRLKEQGVTLLITTHYMDEAERCHYLAILEAGVKRADDTPKNLMANMGANVVEVSGPNLRQLKQQLLRHPHIHSVAQQGVQLRVLVDRAVDDPIAWLLTDCTDLQPVHQLAIVRPSLEDVFVTCTGGRS